MRSVVTLLFICTAFFSSTASADLILSAPPREHAAEGVKTYGNLAQRLSDVLGEKVVYEQPKSWAEYANKMRNDKYDIIFDGPHFAAWRIKNIGHKAVARLPGHLAFKIVAKKDDNNISDVKSLRAASVCAFASPNLTASTLLDQFRNEIIVPRIVAVQGSMGDIFKSLKDGACDAAVLRDQYYEKKLSEADRATLKVVYSSQKYPNQGVSVSSRMSDEKVLKVAKLLEQNEPSLLPITNRFAKKAKKFVPSKNSDYIGISRLLEGVVWGW